VLFDEADARDSLPKAEAARRQIARFNSSVTVHAHIADLVPAKRPHPPGHADIILDCTDNFETRYLINDSPSAQAAPGSTPPPSAPTPPP
jgi:molybdopterin/thiamine biosynthesis adenylyltransferase